MKTLAIISPNELAYSESFIQAHKNLPFKIKYYFGGFFPTSLEGYGKIATYNRISRIRNRFSKKFSISELSLMTSFKRENVDCVLAEYGPTASKVLNVVKHLDIPMVVHFHGFDASHKPTIDEFAEHYKKVFKYAQAVIVVSKKMNKALLKLGCPSDKIVLATYGPNEAYLGNKPLYKKQQFIAVGRFVDKKAPYLTIAAFNKVLQEFPNAKLLMVGDGPLLNTCKKLTAYWNIENSIEFKGVKTCREILSYMEDSIAFLQHSIIADSGDSEGAPVAILEAQAAALPVISTIHAGIPDVVINNETGFLVEEEDVETMAKYLIRILKEDGLAKTLGEAGRKRIIENFSMKKHLGAIENTINNILK